MEYRMECAILFIYGYENISWKISSQNIDVLLAEENNHNP